MTRSRPRIVIVGAGVAGLETLLALRALAADKVEVTLLAPELRFVNRSMSTAQPFSARRLRGIPLQDIAARWDAHWHRGVFDRVDTRRKVVVTRDRDELAYDILVLAPGSRSGHASTDRRVLTYRGGPDAPHVRLLLQQLRDARCTNVGFVKPAGAGWPVPLYDLALMTAADCAAHGLHAVTLSLITPEDEPLGIFGSTAGAAVAELLDDRGVEVHLSSYVAGERPGRLEIAPGERYAPVDRIVTLPRQVGPLLRGVPSGRDGFIATDPHGRVPGLDDVFAAGDATEFAIKQGGLAAQQADAVAEMIAASAGVGIEPRPFRPVLRGVLLTGGRPLYLRADISGSAGDDSTASQEPLWWPPDKLAARYLSPYLSGQVGSASDVMPPVQAGVPDEDASGLMAKAHVAPDELCEVVPSRQTSI